MTKKHGERAHSKFSASGSERWHNCPGSVMLSEGIPDKSSPWAAEGTAAHEILETIMLSAIRTGATKVGRVGIGHREGFSPKQVDEMKRHAVDAANFILKVHHEAKGSELFVENRVYLSFIHPEMFGTFDGAVLEHFGTLHVFDFKYGAGHAVTPQENLQMIFYAIGLAAKFDWNFSRARLWIIQPRVKGNDGPLFWELTIEELRGYVKVFEDAVRRVETEPQKYIEGSWCHWCKAKGVCPTKQQSKLELAKMLFTANPINEGGKDGQKEKSKKGRDKKKSEEAVAENFAGYDDGDFF